MEMARLAFPDFQTLAVQKRAPLFADDGLPTLGRCFGGGHTEQFENRVVAHINNLHRSLAILKYSSETSMPIDFRPK